MQKSLPLCRCVCINNADIPHPGTNRVHFFFKTPHFQPSDVSSRVILTPKHLQQVCNDKATSCANPQSKCSGNSAFHTVDVTISPAFRFSEIVRELPSSSSCKSFGNLQSWRGSLLRDPSKLPAVRSPLTCSARAPFTEQRLQTKPLEVGVKPSTRRSAEVMCWNCRGWKS